MIIVYFIVTERKWWGMYGILGLLHLFIYLSSLSLMTIFLFTSEKGRKYQEHLKMSSLGHIVMNTLQRSIICKLKDVLKSFPH